MMTKLFKKIMNMVQIAITIRQEAVCLYLPDTGGDGGRNRSSWEGWKS